ncbi:hypothetical protein C6P40_002687 [Pichia californica]|uniref:Minichromosome loss protein Mcl1 middle region domain-containing protein n=1 Tax=Pichia californica TaxID=460514 RepID=A0A9P6WQB0_9ASCO|nr:hypothetical protein C6P42_001672 [[Candida] californica]KAG0691296.1 hypothetical protein C6P40_002687 [[Candida] californica]
MLFDDKITHAYFNDTVVEVASTKTTLFTASNLSIKAFNLKNSSSEPEIVNTLDNVKSIDLRSANNKTFVLISGGNDCVFHDLTDFVVRENDAQTNEDTGISEMKNIWKSSSKIMDAIFTHGGQRACVGDLAANLAIIDISNPNDQSTFGKMVEKIKVNGEIIGLSYSYSVDLLAITVADGGLSIYSLSSNIPEKKATIGNVMTDKRIALTHEMGLVDDDSDLSDNSSDDEDSMITESTTGINGKKQRKKNENLLKFAASKSIWSPTGDILAVPNKNFKIDFYNIINWNNPIFSLNAGPLHHKNNISSIAFSPNGKYLATTDLDNILLLWNIDTKKMIARTELPILSCDISWPDNSSVIFGSNKGEILTLDENSFKTLLNQRSIREEVETVITTETDNNQNQQQQQQQQLQRKQTTGTEEDSDEEGDDVMQSNDEEDEEERQLDQVNFEDMDGFVIDDENLNDNYGYTENENRRRNHDNMSESTELTDANKRARKEANKNESNHMYRLNIKSGWGKALTKPFSVGSTPWEGSDRRYLSITPVGCVYSVKTQETYKVTVLFFDEENHTKYFFDDISGFDLCCINDQGSVFATSGYKKPKGFIARVEYKDHSDGKNAETKWIREIALRPYEFITSLSVYGNYVFVCTNKGFVRKFNLFGRLLNISMMDCIVGIMNNNTYVFTIIKRSIESGYFFNIQNINDEYIQQEVGIPLITENDLNDSSTSDIPIKSMFFSDDGEPCIVRNDNLLMVLTNWRSPENKPIWKPLLDIQEGVSRAGKGRELKAWPLGLFGNSFTFVPFRGSKNFPIFPLLTPMNVDIRIPVNYVNPEKKFNDRLSKEADAELFGDDMDSNKIGEDGNEDDDEDGEDDSTNIEEKFLRTIVLAEMCSGSLNDENVDREEVLEKLQLLSLEYDKALLIQIDNACTNGDSDDAFDLCKMIRDFRALNAAQKLAEVQGMAGLARRIRDLREAKIAEADELEGLDEDD